ncbi:origin recognition complex subunit 4 [Plutella xylostella]|uniref:origin recognition complex subunit 4 n=1 Tax=Plutella xylostella TaxID=51655 RepID=UPI002032373D|nr:origin recognition complex subunit 4 [Plutella xylostella]
MLDSSVIQIKLIRKYLKIKLLDDNVSFRGHALERSHVYDLMRKTIVQGESNSALVIGARGSGKTTLINSVLQQLSSEVDLDSDAIVVRLSGLLHHDDKVALKAITAQMQLDNAVGERVFGSFAENLSFLISCLQSGADRRCKSMVFVLDEFDMFCHGVKTQTLLYNLFDITHQGQAPVCVIGLTCRLDVMELLEKRVKSRFSHRHINLYPVESNEIDPDVIEKSPLETFLNIFVQLLSMPLELSRTPQTPRKKGRKKSIAQIESLDSETGFSVPKDVLDKCKVDPGQFSELDRSFLEDWNSHIIALSEDQKVVDVIEKFCYYTLNEQIFRDVLFQIVSKLCQMKPYIDANDICSAIDNSVAPEHRVKLLQSLSILELSLVIAMKHGLDIFDGQPMNFEMVLHRYTKFANTNSSTQAVPRPVILKAFEHLQALEVIMPVKGTDSIYSGTETTASRVQKEYQFFMLAVPISDVDEAVKGFKALPTEISHWYSNSVF